MSCLWNYPGMTIQKIMQHLPYTCSLKSCHRNFDKPGLFRITDLIFKKMRLVDIQMQSQAYLPSCTNVLVSLEDHQGNKLEHHTKGSIQAASWHHCPPHIGHPKAHRPDHISLTVWLGAPTLLAMDKDAVCLPHRKHYQQR
jgi:hypothetical protein